MRLLYSLGILLYGLVVRMAAPFKPKAKLWVEGRKDWRNKIPYNQGEKKTFWMHAASLGEFEQGRAVLEQYKLANPDYFIVLSFFSPSGYEVRKNYPLADVVCYLPLDTKQNAHDFVEHIKPDIAVFIKYEFWFHHLGALQEKGVRTYLVSGRIHRGQTFFKSWGAYFRNGLGAFTHFLVQNEDSKTLLGELGYENVTLSGDTRFDRVLDVVNESKDIKEVEEFVSQGQFLMVAGSTWPYEEIMLENHLQQRASRELRLVIAPHEIDRRRIEKFRSRVKAWNLDSALYSEYTSDEAKKDILFIDSIGLLSSIYRYADICMVGGGFGNGIHNILEPAAWGKTILIGPRYEMFPEAVGLVECGGAIVVNEQQDFEEVVARLMNDRDELRSRGQAAKQYCLEKAGATDVVMSFLNG